MERIGFVDIHPRSPLFGQPRPSPAEEQSGDDPSVIYCFTGTGGEYVYEKTLAYDAQDAGEDIDEFYVSLPATVLDFRVLSFPFSDKEKIADVIPLELHNLIIGEPGEMVFDSIVLRHDDLAADVLVVYTRRQLLAQVLEGLAQRKIDPRAITSLDLTPPVLENGQVLDHEEYLNSILSSKTGDENDRISAAEREISGPTINLRTGAFAYTKDAEKTGRALRMTMILGFLLLFAIHANILFQAFMVKKESSAMAEQMRVSYRSLFPAEKRITNELIQLKSHVREIKEISDSLTGVTPLHLLLELSKRMGPDVVVTEIHLEKGLTKMKAEAPSLDDLTGIKKKLSEFLTDVSISDAKPGAQGKVSFTVVAKGQAS